MRRRNQTRLLSGAAACCRKLSSRSSEAKRIRWSSRWLEQLGEGGVALQVCAVYQSPQSDHGDALREVLRQIAGFHTAVESNPEVFAVGGRRDLELVGTNGLGLLLAIEGVSSFGEDLLAARAPWRSSASACSARPGTSRTPSPTAATTTGD